MTDSPTRRRCIRFSLRGLLIVVTLVAVWLGWNVHVIRQRKAALAWMASRDIQYSHKPFARGGPFLPLTRRLLGDAPVTLIICDDAENGLEKRFLSGVFPEAEILEVITEPDWSEEQVARLFFHLLAVLWVMPPGWWSLSAEHATRRPAL